MRYDATVTRDGRWWLVEVPAAGVTTQARRLGDVAGAAREAVAVTLDVPLSQVEVDVTVGQVGEVLDVGAEVARIASEAAEAERLRARAIASRRNVARQLAAAGVPVRDIGEVLGVSFQRAQQLVSGDAAPVRHLKAVPSRAAVKAPARRPVAAKARAVKSAAKAPVKIAARASRSTQPGDR